MRPWVAVAAAAAAIAVLAPSSPAQSLGEIAARTNKKKDEAKSGKPAKVYTESDLRGRPSTSGNMSQMDGAAGTPEASPAPGAARPAGEKPKTEEEARAEALTDWRERLAHAESEVARISAEIDRSQTALNDFSGPMYGGNRAAAVARVEEGKRQLVLAQQFLADIQEEGRRARFR